jgi:SSS family solute:Na+ symporter
VNLGGLDWSIVLAVALFLVYQAYRTRKYAQGVSGFLAADRCAGRYIITIGEAAAMLGAVSIVGDFQRYYSVGFGTGWWGSLGIPVFLLMTMTGFVIYRYRETRAMTLGQFLEMRYSRKLRIFAGSLVFVSGLANFGIFPAVGANFFINYCGLPESYSLLGFNLDTYPSITFILLAVAVYFTLIGGQISVLVTDFIQGFFVNIVLVAILFVILFTFNLSDVFDALLLAPEGKSMVNPFKTGDIDDFSFWYFLIIIIIQVYNRMGWQGAQAYHCSAKNPHEAKMAGILGTFRGWGFTMSLLLLPICAFMVMNHEDYTDTAAHVNSVLSTIENEEVRDQMITPVVMTTFLPIGFMGAFAAVMFAAFISTNDTQMHSWASIFVQDIAMPLRKKPFTPERHMTWLRWAIVGVAAFAFIFSLFFRQTQHIMLYFLITGAIWLGGSGSVIIGGLYWKRGTTAAAWAALITGATFAIAGIVLDQVWNSYYDKDFLIDYKWMTAISMGASIIVYVLVSLLGSKEKFNLDKMLHREQYALPGDHPDGKGVHSSSKWSLKQFLGYTAEFTRGDKIIYGISIAFAAIQLLAFVTMTTIAFTTEVTDRMWCNYHYYFVGSLVVASIVVAVWLSLGGLRDIRRLFVSLRQIRRDDRDDGTVIS